MVDFIKKVPKFQAVCFTGLASVAELARLAGTNLSIRGIAGYRVESGCGKPILFLKTNDAAGRVVPDADIKMEVGEVLVLSKDSGVLTVMSGEAFQEQFEVAP
jgi:hypothetical protein